MPVTVPFAPPARLQPLARQFAPHPIRTVIAILAFAAAAMVALPVRADERAVTDALIWVGASERVARRTLDRRDASAIGAVERRLGGYADGRLDGGERRALLAAARHAREREGYRTITDPATGARIGLPTAWLGPRRATDGGSAWVSPDGAIAVETFGVSNLDAFERAERARPGVDVTYAAGRGRWRVVSGYEPGGRTVYARAGVRQGRASGFRVTYETALGERLDRVAVAMSSDFRPGTVVPEAIVPEAVPEAVDLLAYAPRTVPSDGRFDDGRLDDGRFEPSPPRHAALPDAGPAPRERPAVAALEREIVRTLDPVPGRVREVTPRPSTPLSLDDADDGRSLDPVRGGAGLDAPVPDTGETEPAVEGTITGFVTDEGQSCPTLRGPDGTLYALVGEVPVLVPGTLVTIEAVGVDTTRCSAGRTVAVGGLSVVSSPR